MQKPISSLQLLLVGVASLMSLTTTRVSRSRIGDVEMYVNDTVWKCDRIYCPPNTDRCRVSKIAGELDTVLVRENTCYSKDNQVLQQKVTKTLTIIPLRVETHWDFNREGKMTVSSKPTTFLPYVVFHQLQKFATEPLKQIVKNVLQLNVTSEQ